MVIDADMSHNDEGSISSGEGITHHITDGNAFPLRYMALLGVKALLVTSHNGEMTNVGYDPMSKVTVHKGGLRSVTCE